MDEFGRFKGALQPTGLRPYLLEKLAESGIDLPPDAFTPAPAPPAPAAPPPAPAGRRVPAAS